MAWVQSLALELPHATGAAIKKKKKKKERKKERKAKLKSRFFFFLTPNHVYFSIHQVKSTCILRLVGTVSKPKFSIRSRGMLPDEWKGDKERTNHRDEI